MKRRERVQRKGKAPGDEGGSDGTHGPVSVERTLSLPEDFISAGIYVICGEEEVEIFFAELERVGAVVH